MVRFHHAVKIPQGKMLVLDGSKDERAFSVVALSGDYFCFPDDALEGFSAAMKGVPLDTDFAGLASKIQLLLPPGTELVGISVEDIAGALRQIAEGAGDCL